MTVIELFDRFPVENIVSCLSTAPDKLILVGDGKAIHRSLKPYADIFARHGLNTVLEECPVDRTNLSAIVTTLSKIVETEKECVFDLTRGDELALVAIGIVFEKYRGQKNIQLQRFRFRNGKICDCDGDGKIITKNTPNLSIDEQILLYGGTVSSEKSLKAPPVPLRWELTDDFVRIVRALWNVARKKPSAWNAQINRLKDAERDSVPGSDPLRAVLDLPAPDNRTSHNTVSRELLSSLQKVGAITELRYNESTVTFRYHSEAIRQCLSKAGTVLEMKVYLEAMLLKDRKCNSIYTDAVTGVCIQWDSLNSSNSSALTQNEIDVMLMKNLTPIFISCKNGNVEDDELYKLNTVASRFGGMQAKKVLIVTNMGRKSETGRKYFRLRARDMDIRLVENTHLMSDASFRKMLENLFL